MSAMTAFTLPLLLYFFWFLLGYPLFTLLSTRRHSLRTILLSPSLGMAITLLPVFYLSRYGLSVAQCAKPLMLVYGFCIAFSWIWIRPIFSYRRILSFWLLLLLALTLSGWPLLRFGFHWISYVNDDMNNYCLAALRFLHHGYFEMPNLKAMLSGQRYDAYYWIFHVGWMARAGSELQLAWLSSITGLPPLALFMPLILALHLCLLSAAGGLAYVNRRSKKRVLALLFFVAVSPLNSLGSLYQLIAQVGGLSLLITLSALLLQIFSKNRRYAALRMGMLLAIISATLFIYYPEVFSIIVLAFFIYLLLSLLSRKHFSKHYCTVLFFATALSTLLLLGYFDHLIGFAKTQISNGLSHATADIFPYFFMPQGFAYLFGIIGIGESGYSHIFMGAAILFGFFLLLATSLSAINSVIKKQSAPAVVLLAMLLLAGLLFYTHSGFGLFKLAMYAQVFLLLNLLIVSRFFLKKNPKATYCILFILILSNLHTQTYYVKRSLGTPGPFQELAFGSELKLAEVFQGMVQSIPTKTALAYCSSSLTLVKLLLQYNGDHPADLVSHPFFKTYFLDANPVFITVRDKKQRADIFNAITTLKTQYTESNFQYENYENAFEHRRNFFTDHPDLKYIFPGNQLGVFNRAHTNNQTLPLLMLNKKMARNYLIFIHSRLGQYYYFASDPQHIGLFPMQSDAAFPKQGLAGIGRYLLLRVLQPRKKARLLLNLSNTQLSHHTLPQISLIGNSTQTLSVTGDGSARLVSEPLSFQRIDGLAYLMLHLQATKAISAGPQSLARNISMLSEDDYQQMLRDEPEGISHFPTDLANPALRYSGIDEEGYIATQATVYLKKIDASTALFVEGQTLLPQTRLSVLVNGLSTFHYTLPLGNFSVKVPVQHLTGHVKLSLAFSKTTKGSAHNHRQRSAKIMRMEFAR